jgi:hypothetical protein
MENRQTVPGAPAGWFRRHATTLLLVVTGLLLLPVGVQAASNIVQITDRSGKNIAEVDPTGTLHVRPASDLSPFQKTIHLNVRAGDGEVGSETVTHVPPGRRLVLDYVSGWASISGCSRQGDYLAWVLARLDPIRGTYQRFYVPTSRTPMGEGAANWHFGTPLHAVAGADTNVYASLQRDGGCGVLGAMTVSGHFVED